MLQTRVLQHEPVNPKVWHDAQTQNIRIPEGGRTRRDTVPEPHPPSVVVRQTKKPADDFDEDEETSLPLSDDDLEPA